MDTTKRICSQCGVEKDWTTDNFYFNRTTGQWNKTCQDCKRENNREYVRRKFHPIERRVK